MERKMDWMRMAVAAALVLSVPVIAQATPIVWVGGGANDVTFTKAGGADETDEANQDRITSNVWLTRDFEGGLYNVVTEAGYTKRTDEVPSPSPEDTEWAFSGFNGNDSFLYVNGASDWSNQTFTDLATSLAKHIGGNIINVPGILHLITDDIYMDIVITTWTASKTDGQPTVTGGGVEYTRAPEPASLCLLGLGAIAMLKRRRRRDA